MGGDLGWGGLRNARDVGGLASDAGVVADRVLVRSEALTRLDAAGRAALEAYAVARIIDLRADGERAQEPSPYADDERYRPVPWVDVDAEPEAGWSDLAAIYRATLDRNGGTVAEAVRTFVSAPPGPVLVHCAGGKDRTGMLVAALLTVTGVPREDILSDYARSERRLGVADYLASLPEQERRRVDRFAWSRAETLASALDHLDRVYGGVAGYLRAAGLTDAELAGVRRRLLG